MRGKVFQLFSSCRTGGITPAYAGKSLTCFFILVPCEDHPRLCGEKVSRVFRLPSNAGSPPPMRGKVFSAVLPILSNGITPAYAGKSLGLISIRSHIQDHPRLCGEKVFSAATPSSSPGSPPPMRGKGIRIQMLSFGTRITPAYAGKRSCNAAS